MKNELYFKVMRNEAKFNVVSEFSIEFKKNLEDFYNENKNLPENEFKKKFDDEYLEFINFLNNKRNSINIKGIYNILIFFTVLSIISFIIIIIAASNIKF